MPDDRDLEPIRVGAHDAEPRSPEHTAGHPHLASLLSARREADYVVDLRFLFVSLWSGKWVLLCFLVAGIALAAWRLYTHEPAYEAYLVVAPTVATSPFSGMRDSASGFRVPPE